PVKEQSTRGDDVNQTVEPKQDKKNNVKTSKKRKGKQANKDSNQINQHSSNEQLVDDNLIQEMENHELYEQKHERLAVKMNHETSLESRSLGHVLIAIKYIDRIYLDRNSAKSHLESS